MIKTSLPRYILTLSLSGVVLVTSVISVAPKAYAQNPCPKDMTCASPTATPAPSATPAASTVATSSNSASTGGMILQAVMVLLRIS